MRNRIRFVPDTTLAKKEGPNHGNLVWVHCKEYNCLAYVDEKGDWINFYDGKRLDDFVRVVGR